MKIMHNNNINSGFTLNSHLDVVIVSDLIDGSTAKEVETLVSSLSKRLAHSSPFRFVREKIVFHINRDATVLSQISRLYSNSRLASPAKTKTPDVAAASADTPDQANNIPAKAISAVPRASMEVRFCIFAFSFIVIIYVKMFICCLLHSSSG